MIVLFGIIATATSALSGWYIYTGLTDEFKTKGTSIARIISDSAVGILLNSDPATLQSILDEYLDIVGVSYILVADSGGVIVSHTFVPGIPENIEDLSARMSKKYLNTDIDIEPFTITESDDLLNITSPILGGVAGYVIVGMDLSLIKSQIISIVLRQQVLIFTIFLFAIGLSYLLINRISSPLNRLTEHATRLASSDLSDFKDISSEIEPIARSSKDEIGDLAQSFVFMEGKLQDSINQLAETISAKERIEGELGAARDIQLNILPKHLPQKREIELQAKIEPAREVGGDFYDFFFINNKNNIENVKGDSSKLFFVIGDVSGKGVPAALFMAVTKTLIKATASMDLSPSEVLTKVNKELSVDNDACMFVTLFCGMLNITSGELSYCSAGHNPPYLLTKTGASELVQENSCIALGILEDAQYLTSKLTLNKGDGIFLYTDGVTEAMNVENNDYSDEKLKQFLQNLDSSDPQDIINNVYNDVVNFTDGASQYDDITMLAIKYLG